MIDKTDINNIQVGLSFVEKLRPVTFKWDKREWYTDGNRDGSKKDEAGLIAEDVDKILPNLVTKDQDGRPDAIHYTKLTAYLIEAVKSLKAEINSLKGI